MFHGHYPVMWLDNTSNLLFVASVYQNGIEYLDLRCDNRTWNVVKMFNSNQTLHNLFGCRMLSTRHRDVVSRLCII